MADAVGEIEIERATLLPLYLFEPGFGEQGAPPEAR